MSRIATQTYIVKQNFFIMLKCLFQEEKKIMYYYPKNDHIDTKIKQIGLCEAICKFTE